MRHDTIFLEFHLNHESNDIFFCSHHPLMLVGEAPIRWWSGSSYLSPKPGIISGRHVISLLPEKTASATLAQCLIKRWWDTTHTFYITEWEMTVTPYEFYRMIGLSFEGAIISLDGASGVQLSIDMLGRKYSTETIRYVDLVSDYMFLP